MAKLTALVAISAILFLVVVAVDASIYQTTVITTDIDEENPQRPSRGGCQQQIQSRDFSQCERYIEQLGQRFEILGRQDQYLQRCCQQLSQVDEQCRSQAVEEVAREQQQQGRYRGEQMQEMLERARSIPRMCRFDMGPQ